MNTILEDFEINKRVDLEISSWSFTETLSGLFVVLAIYLGVVLKILPKYMKSRPALRLKTILLYYNAFQVVYSTVLVIIYLKYIFQYGIITTRCAKGETLKTLKLEIYPYFVAKHLDLLDTVFFVLRKKDSQVSFLHLFHHAIMITWTWFHVMFYPTDHFVVVGMLNSLVHVVMYAYYGLTSLGPEYSKFVWWKKHLTKIQLIQFILVVTHLHYQQKITSCPIPQFFHYFCMSSILSFFGLFLKFYVRSYRNRNKGDKHITTYNNTNVGCQPEVSFKYE